MRLNYDCCVQVLQYVPIEDLCVASYALAPDMSTYRSLVAQRRNLGQFFSRVVKNAAVGTKRHRVGISDLLNAMKKSESVAVGPQALEYFVPGSCRVDSSYDFYIPWSPGKHIVDTSTDNPMKRIFTHMGTTWKDPKPAHRTPTGVSSMRRVLRYNVLEGTMRNNAGNVVTVRLLYSTYDNIIDFMLSQPYTHYQCFITWGCAVHMYGKMTATNSILVWWCNRHSLYSRIEGYNFSECDPDYITPPVLPEYYNSSATDLLDMAHRKFHIRCSVNRDPVATESMIPILTAEIQRRCGVAEQLADCARMLADHVAYTCSCIWVPKDQTDGYYSVEWEEHEEKWPLGSPHRKRYIGDSQCSVVVYGGPKLHGNNAAANIHSNGLSKYVWYERWGCASRTVDCGYTPTDHVDSCRMRRKEWDQ